MPGHVYGFFERVLGKIEQASVQGNHSEVVRLVGVAKMGAIAIDEGVERVNAIAADVDAT